MKTILLFTFLMMVSAQVVSYTDSTYNFTFYHLSTLYPTNDATGPYYPYNYFRSILLNGS